jgi:hypothetical protein
MICLQSFSNGILQYWFDIPMMAPEDCLDDVIENIPAEEDPTNADRKEIDTWAWFVIAFNPFIKKSNK